MVDRTIYPDGKAPDLALRQVFGRQRLPAALCLLMAETGLSTVETFAMLGDTIAGVKTTMKTLINDDTKLGPNNATQELSLTSLAAVWKTCSSLQEHFAARRAKMEEDPTKVPEIPGDDHAEFREQFVGRHPDVLLPPHREPHRKLVERIQRDFLVHGAVPFYQVGEFRTRSEQVIQKSGISKTADDLIKVVAVDQPVQAASEAQVLDKLHCFFVALEYLNICEFTVAAGPLKYLAELEEWRHENKGLALLLTVDTLIRKKVHRLNHDRRKEFSTFSKALLEVLVNHKQIWNDARSSAELDKQAIRILRHRTVQQRGRDHQVNVITLLSRHPPSRRRTKRGGSVRRQFSPKPRLPSQGRHPRRHLPGTIVFQKRSGKRSLVSSTQVREGARFSTAPWAVALLMDAGMLMRVWSAVRLMHGMAIIELQ